MFVSRTLFALAAASAALGNILTARQSTNTNAEISTIVNTLSVTVHQVAPTVLTEQANHTATDGTIGSQVNTLITAFTNAETALAATAVSAGSTTVLPTNDDISIIVANIVSIVASTLSGLTTTVVPSFTDDESRLDPSLAGFLTQFNVTLPGGINLVHTMMLDAQQFLVKEGAFPQTLGVLGF
ncbi:hypothetical protein H0H93_001049 [Arthromyces matolae]|nr:hypothetical protein H0H93_001049 [Arthromyces matolae]